MATKSGAADHTTCAGYGCTQQNLATLLVVLNPSKRTGGGGGGPKWDKEKPTGATNKYGHNSAQRRDGGPEVVPIDSLENFGPGGATRGVTVQQDHWSRTKSLLRF